MTEPQEQPKRRPRVDEGRKESLQFSSNMLEYTTKLEFLLNETSFKLARIQQRFQKITEFANDLSAAGYTVPLPTAEVLKQYQVAVDPQKLWEEAEQEAALNGSPPSP